MVPPLRVSYYFKSFSDGVFFFLYAYFEKGPVPGILWTLMFLTYQTALSHLQPLPTMLVAHLPFSLPLSHFGPVPFHLFVLLVFFPTAVFYTGLGFLFWHFMAQESELLSL
ncbi:hypothetical protein V8C26DRAFT_46764 [Trichoderma gracile]